MPEKYLLIHDGDFSAAYNMAFDEILLENSAKFAKPLLRLYGFDSPSITIGYSQYYDAASDNKHTVVRRPTGGGVVYHDRDLTYTFVVPPGHYITELDRIESYHFFHRGILEILKHFNIYGVLSRDMPMPNDMKRMQCFSSPTRYDVIVDGVKYAGAAQRRSRKGILHQGSIMLEKINCDKDSFRKILIKTFENYFDIEFEKIQADKNIINQSKKLENEKYSRKSWNMEKIK